jgi:hypothetical protein
MTTDEIKQLGERLAKGEATPEEKLRFLKELNEIVEGMRSDLQKAKTE